jgi:DNA replicative helicase MCM subunit Mcm2 (Cdc46/Mcm family)
MSLDYRPILLSHQLFRETVPLIINTCLQLEAVVRISEALAKMQLKPFASPAHVEESLRLFHVSVKLLIRIRFLQS